MTHRLVPFLTLGRVKFLCYSPLLYGLGAAIATMRGAPFAPGVFVFGQVLVWVTHLMTHYYNEYYDLDTDTLNRQPSPWTGGSRVLPRGELPPASALAAGRVSLALAGGMSLLMPSRETQLICWLAIILSWGYSAPPLRLSRRGLGEWTTTVVLNILTPLLGFMLQHGQMIAGRTRLLLVVLLPLAIIEYIRMMVMNMPDREADSAVGKRTLIVKIGMPWSVRLYAAGMAGAYGVALVSYIVGMLPGAFFWPFLLSVPLAVASTAGVLGRWRDPQAFFRVPYWASTHNGIAAWAMLVGAVLLQSRGWFWQPIAHIKVFAVYLYPAVVGYLGYLRPALAGWQASRGSGRAIADRP